MAFHKLESVLQRRIKILFLLSDLFSLHMVGLVEDYCCTWQHTHMNTRVQMSTCTCAHTQIHAHTHTQICVSTHIYEHIHVHMHVLSRTLQGWITTYNQELLIVESNTTLCLYIYKASQRFLSLYYRTLCKPNEPQRNNGWIKGA